MKRPSYRAAAEWIASNDDPGGDGSLNPEHVAGYISTCLAADLFGVPPERVARDVVAYRERDFQSRDGGE